MDMDPSFEGKDADALGSSGRRGADRQALRGPSEEDLPGSGDEISSPETPM
jgi:hypothetical protein